MRAPAFLFLFLSSVSICSARADTEAMCAKCPAQGAVAPRSPTNDEINAAETGSPDSVENRNTPEPEISGNVNAEWEALETGNPDLAQPGNRFAVAATSPAEKCDCATLASRTRMSLPPTPPGPLEPK